MVLISSCYVKFNKLFKTNVFSLNKSLFWGCSSFHKWRQRLMGGVWQPCSREIGELGIFSCGCVHANMFFFQFLYKTQGLHVTSDLKLQSPGFDPSYKFINNMELSLYAPIYTSSMLYMELHLLEIFSEQYQCWNLKSNPPTNHLLESIMLVQIASYQHQNAKKNVE